ncbi:MAG: hypothetical protein Q9Q40_00015 [Acidobacteriota bacterium]|nr:hypothetical protein [Acidobacteriota bacterium]
MKTIDLRIRPIHHRLEERVRAHVFLGMLACYVGWHMTRALARLLFVEEGPEGDQRRRKSTVTFEQTTCPETFQRRAFDLLGENCRPETLYPVP